MHHTKQLEIPKCFVAEYVAGVMERTSGSLRDKYIAGMTALLDPFVDIKYRRQIAGDIFAVLDYFGLICEEINPVHSLDELCSAKGINRADARQIVSELEQTTQVYLPDYCFSYPLTRVANGCLKPRFY